MNLSFKDLRFIIKAIEHQINAYKERFQVIEDVDEDEAADLGNDIKFLELLHADMTTTLEHNNSFNFLSSDDTFSPVWQDNYSEVSKDLSFQKISAINAEVVT
ncbi:MAG: hypothetical protein WBA89_13510 [Microcoleus sp.]|uniref:hypothetical protein n=1 Tax=Microcoleus sp. TaxID=44472 RepID=UPI003C7146A0